MRAKPPAPLPTGVSVAPGTGVSAGGPGSVFLQLGQDAGTLVMRGEGREAVLPPLTHPGRLLIDGLRTAASRAQRGSTRPHQRRCAHPCARHARPHPQPEHHRRNTRHRLERRHRPHRPRVSRLSRPRQSRRRCSLPASQEAAVVPAAVTAVSADAVTSKTTSAPFSAVTTAPTSPGGGGGSDSGPAGHGGGVLRLIAQRLVLDGLIVADGAPASTFGGAGAGGSLWITTPRLEGSGSIRANGGAPSSNSGAGGGGRIALEYAEAPQAMIDGIAARSGRWTLCRRFRHPLPPPWQRHPHPPFPPSRSRNHHPHRAPFRNPRRRTQRPGRGQRRRVRRHLHRLRVRSPHGGSRSPRVTVLAGGVLTHPAMISTNPVLLVMDVGTLTLTSNAAINLTGRGYLGSQGLANRVGDVPPGIPGSGPSYRRQSRRSRRTRGCRRQRRHRFRQLRQTPPPPAAAAVLIPARPVTAAVSFVSSPNASFWTASSLPMAQPPRPSAVPAPVAVSGSPRRVSKVPARSAPTAAPLRPAPAPAAAAASRSNTPKPRRP
jgi:hypothetical protein